MRRLACFAVVAAMLFVGRAARADQTYSRTMTFAANHQNPWGYITDPSTGLPVAMDFGHFDYKKTTQDLFGDINTSLDFGLFFNLDPTGLSDENTGAGVEINIQNTAIGFEFESIATGGDVGLKYPGTVTLTYPDPQTLYPGDTFTVGAQWAPDAGSGSMASTKSTYELKLSALIKSQITISAVVKILGDTIWSQQLYTLTFGGGPAGSSTEFDKYTLVDLNNDILSGIGLVFTDKGQFTAFNNILQGDFIHPPGVATSTVPSGSSSILKSEGEDTFLTLRLDVTNLILAILGEPTIEGSHSYSGDGFSLGVDLHVLDLFGELDFGLKDQFQFQGAPQVTVMLGDGSVRTFDSGSSLTLTMPTVGAGAQTNNLTLAPSFALANSNTMSHASYLMLDPSVKFQPFEVGVSIDCFGLFSDSKDFKPIDDIDLWSGKFGIDFLTPNPKTFTLPGFNVVATDALQITGYTYPQPTLSSVSPAARALNSGGFTLTVNGSGFVPSHSNSTTTLPSSTVYWDGLPRATTYVNGTTLTAAITAADVSVEKAHQVTVGNPSPGGGTSNALSVIVDGTGPAVTVTATPSLISPVGKPGAVVGVTVSGTIIDAGVGVDPTTAQFSVTDEYGLVQPSGPVTLAPDGSYSFVVTLQPTRQSGDTDGRQYTINVSAKDKVGNLGKGSAVVTVTPH